MMSVSTVGLIRAVNVVAIPTMLAGVLSPASTTLVAGVLMSAGSTVFTQIASTTGLAPHSLPTAVVAGAAVICLVVSVPSILFCILSQIVGGRHTSSALTYRAIAFSSHHSLLHYAYSIAPNDSPVNRKVNSLLQENRCCRATQRPCRHPLRPQFGQSRQQNSRTVRHW